MPRTKEPRFCKRCSKLITGRGKLFCSILCDQKYSSEQFVDKWLAGEVSGTQKCGSVVIPVRNYMIQSVAENKCMECGWDKKNPVTNKCPLELHHVDGDSLNSSRLNLIVLCPNCHSLTETFRALNKVSSRVVRATKKSESPAQCQRKD